MIRAMTLSVVVINLILLAGCNSWPFDCGSAESAAPTRSDGSVGFPTELQAVMIEFDPQESDSRAAGGRAEAVDAFTRGFLWRGYRVVASAGDLERVIANVRRPYLDGNYEEEHRAGPTQKTA